MIVSDILQFYVGLLTKDNVKVALKQQGPGIVLDEFYISDQIVVHSVTEYIIHPKKFMHIETIIECTFDKVVENFDNIQGYK